jgi:hypothetical protein
MVMVEQRLQRAGEDSWRDNSVEMAGLHRLRGSFLSDAVRPAGQTQAKNLVLRHGIDA